jgi:hypothetical protein
MMCAVAAIDPCQRYNIPSCFIGLHYQLVMVCFLLSDAFF